MDKSALDTKDWKFTAVLDYELVTKPKNITCLHCGGSGTIGGGFKSLDDPTYCPTCAGTGGWLDYSDIECKPGIPEDLVEILRKALQEYIKTR